MFNIFKNKNKEEIKAVEEFSAQDAKEPVNIADDIVIHAMPEKFRSVSVQASNPKKTGMLIIIGGAVLLMAVSIGLYLYLFSGQEPVQIEENVIEEKPVVKTEKKEEKEQPAANYNTVQPKEIMEIEEPKKTEEEISETPTSTPAIISLSSADGDIDGLSNKEENILGSDSSSADSDGDGYSDLSELIKLYNPAGEGKLIDNPNISQYSNNDFNYGLFYPASWSVSLVGGDESVVFKSNDNQFVQIIAQVNENKETIEDWYIENFNIPSVDNNRKISNESWQGIRSEDEMIVYLTDNSQNSIITVAYTIGEGNVADYINIFEMMVNSLVISNK